MSVTRVNPAGVHALPQLITQVTVAERRRLAYVSGQVAWDENGEPVGRGDHAAQIAQIIRNLDACLASVGATRSDLVKETVYVVEYVPDLAPVIIGALREGVTAPPASTLVAVPALFAPEFLIEVEVVVAIPDHASEAI
ncbi:enamine deaminase RidA (YjgF/YER057c/UK114 family) [Streptosporangium becharense]|uniref:Enamine deaminase RidA (YjgF/YER057c/UK114 family) n=1 Tax=Streptosporangium becharense TaxID=1816182 RepID=A0A7W9IJI9_9ACTN|nr:RidA family protein [Streptosporangium becharense]MBB2911075.1 enamine deaminase RidA (YjgF/YER057c/UK114 family) [Streptosporangium becharense]MBB5821867.1 enamine deaminase RidA (YjgF/YER057c/UK114 family) [Streptosporangium becharense]